MVRQPFEFAQGKAHHKLRMAGNEQGSGGAGEKKISDVEFRMAKKKIADGSTLLTTSVGEIISDVELRISEKRQYSIAER